MKKKTKAKKSKKSDIFSKVFTVSLFLICLSSICIQGFKCFEKYLEKPEAVNIQYEFIGNVTFPEITFCQLPKVAGLQKPHNLSILESCNITYEDYEKKAIWVGKGSELCKNPKDLYEALLPKLADFGLIGVEIHLHKDRKVLKKSPQEFKWKTRSNDYFGTCFTLDLPQNLTNLGIDTIAFKSEFERPAFLFFVHQKGAMLTDLASGSEFYLWTDHTFLSHVDFEIVKLLDYAGKPCTTEKDYDYLACSELKIYQVSID